MSDIDEDIYEDEFDNDDELDSPIKKSVGNTK